MSQKKSEVLKQLSHKKRREGILVPLLEDLFHAPVEFETQADINFMVELMEKMIVRQNERNSAPVFSPSQMASCLRYVYLLRHHKELGITRSRSIRIEPNFYFFTGNFIHLKWQFALHKLDQEIADPSVFRLHGVEVPIFSKHKDHGGTVDAIFSVNREPYIGDFKGLNVRTFSEITRGYVPHQYLVQLADYGMLFNSQRKLSGKITNALLITENKGGPDAQHVIALHETVIPIATYLPEVRSRLEVLRENGKADSIPPPECVSPHTIQFQGCPFRGYCKTEVTEIYRRRKKREAREAEQVTVARPSRTARKRRR